MKRLVSVVTLAILLVGLILFGLGDRDTSLADITVPDNEAATSIGNSSASATITITMYTVANE